MSVDLNVPEGIPHTGVLTSDQGMISVSVEGGDYDLIKVTRGTIRLSNAVSLYREAGTRIGTTYAGNQRVSGTISRAFLNMAEARLALGGKTGASIGTPPQEVFHKSGGILTSDQLEAIMGVRSTFPLDPEATDSFYPWRVNIKLAININSFGATPAVDGDGNPQDNTISQTFGIHSIIAKNCLITNYMIAYDSTGLITSGPLNFQGSAIEWRRDLQTPVEVEIAV